MVTVVFQIQPTNQTTLNLRLKSEKMRYAKILGLLVILTLVVWGTVELGFKQQQYTRLLRGFERIEKNSSSSKVIELMGMPDLDTNQSSTSYTYWNDELLAQDNSDIKREFRYETFQFFLPRSFVVGFNEKDEVVAKRLLD